MGGSNTTVTTPLPYDCNAGLANAQMGWSVSKKAWCCDHMHQGCPTHLCTCKKLAAAGSVWTCTGQALSSASSEQHQVTILVNKLLTKNSAPKEVLFTVAEHK